VVATAGRQAGQYSLVRRAAECAGTASGGWRAAQVWLGFAAQFSARSGRSARPFHRGPRRRRGRPPSRTLTAALAGRASALRILGRAAEAAGDAHRSLALARQIGDPAGELQALAELSFQAYYAGHHDEAVRLAWQAGQITAGIPGATARYCSYV